MYRIILRTGMQLLQLFLLASLMPLIRDYISPGRTMARPTASSGELESELEFIIMHGVTDRAHTQSADGHKMATLNTTKLLLLTNQPKLTLTVTLTLTNTVMVIFYVHFVNTQKKVVSQIPWLLLPLW